MPIDPATALGLALQLAESVLGTVRRLQELRGTPDRVARLLEEVQQSLSRLKAILEPVTHSELAARLALICEPVRSALEELYDVLRPLVSIPPSEGSHGAARLEVIARAWKAVVSLTKQDEISEKLQRVQRLNVDLLRELDVFGLELQKYVTLEEN